MSLETYVRGGVATISKGFASCELLIRAAALEVLSEFQAGSGSEMNPVELFAADFHTQKMAFPRRIGLS